MIRKIPKALSRVLCVCMILTMLSGFAPAHAATAHFKDVPESHWAFDYIEFAYREGAVNGRSAGVYAPTEPVTVAEFLTMLVRAFYADDIDPAAPKSPWYAPYVSAGEKHGLTNGLDPQTYNKPASRYQMAQILFNAIKDMDGTTLPTGVESDLSVEAQLASLPDGMSIPEEYREAVANVYYWGIIKGVDSSNTFAGNNTMTRAVAATVYFTTSAYMRVQNDRYLTVNGTTYHINMAEDAFLAKAGTPDDTLLTLDGYKWYIYGVSDKADYEKNFLMACVKNEKIAALVSEGKAYTYKDYTLDSTGEADPSGIELNNRARGFYDLDGKLHLIFLTSGVYDTGKWYPGDERLSGESKAFFYLVNAYRVNHGLDPLAWNESAAQAARLHAKELADANAHSNNDWNSEDQVIARLKAQGLNVKTASEGNAQAYDSAIVAFGACTTAKGPSNRMLSMDADGKALNFTDLGVGTYLDANADAKLFYILDFFG